MEFWKTKQFKSLYLEWNAKLAASGFVDIEKTQKPQDSAYGKASPLERETRLQYYLFLDQLINQTNFPNEIEAFVMRTHAEGYTLQQIREELILRGNSRSSKTIRFIIRRWQTKWGVKSWSLKQMNLKK